ncbi:RNA polymerase sigma factor [Amycolatopsis sp. NPDC048633]|uniref:RNA polymerase sigma factor n=1 Tax=Amycolatopsis sp. NPDC048633 TaxID=3157095 RepID=UPI00340175FF
MTATTVERGNAEGLGSLSEAEARELVARAASGDRDAWGELFQQGRSTVTRYLSRRISNQADVDDVVHDAFLRLTDRAQAGKLDDVGAVGSWLCGLASYSLTEYGQRQWRRRAEVDETIRASQLEPAEPAYERESRPLSPRVAAALETLTPAQRQAVELRYLDGLSSEGAASTAGISVEAIANRCHKARRQLRAELADLEPEARSPLAEVSKKEAVHQAFAAVGEDDAAKVATWLRDQGVQVSESHIRGIRSGMFGSPPAEVAPEAVRTAPPKRATKGEQVRDAARRFRDEHGALPTIEQLTQQTGVLRRYARAALDDLGAEGDSVADGSAGESLAEQVRRSGDAVRAVEEAMERSDGGAAAEDEQRAERVARWQADDAAAEAAQESQLSYGMAS